MILQSFVKKKKNYVPSGGNDLDPHVNTSCYHLPKEQIILWKQNIKP